MYSSGASTEPGEMAFLEDELELIQTPMPAHFGPYTTWIKMAPNHVSTNVVKAVALTEPTSQITIDVCWRHHQGDSHFLLFQTTTQYDPMLPSLNNLELKQMISFSDSTCQTFIPVELRSDSFWYIAWVSSVQTNLGFSYFVEPL